MGCHLIRLSDYLKHFFLNCLLVDEVGLNQTKRFFWLMGYDLMRLSDFLLVDEVRLNQTKRVFCWLMSGNLIRLSVFVG